MIEVETWAIISTLGGFLVSFIGLAFGIGKYTLWQMQKQLDVRFAMLETVRVTASANWDSKFAELLEVARKDAVEWRQLERDLMALKADMPLNYVRREDYIRGQTVLEAKIDAVALRIENLQLRREMS